MPFDNCHYIKPPLLYYHGSRSCVDDAQYSPKPNDVFAAVHLYVTYTKYYNVSLKIFGTLISFSGFVCIYIYMFVDVTHLYLKHGL